MSLQKSSHHFELRIRQKFFWKLLGFGPLIFVKSCPIAQKRDGCSNFKIYMEKDAIHT
jgi:hypothetical protein